MLSSGALSRMQKRGLPDRPLLYPLVNEQVVSSFKYTSTLYPSRTILDEDLEALASARVRQLILFHTVIATADCGDWKMVEENLCVFLPLTFPGIAEMISRGDGGPGQGRAAARRTCGRRALTRTAPRLRYRHSGNVRSLNMIGLPILELLLCYCDFDFDNLRCVYETVRLIDDRSIYVLCAVRIMLALPAMNMAKDVKPGPDLLDGFCKFFAAEMDIVGMRRVQHAIRRSMRNQNIGARRNHLPISPDRCAARDIEGPVVELGLDRRSPEFQSCQFRTGVFEIDGVGQQFSGSSGVALKHPIVVSSDDDLMPVRQRAKPLVEINDLDWGFAESGKISGMNQDVAVRNAQFSVLAVRIADADNANLGHGNFTSPRA